MNRRKIVYIGFGSNMGDSQVSIEKALSALDSAPGVTVRRVSSLYKTQPVGGPTQPDHLNGVAELLVASSPSVFLRTLKKIEKDLGRGAGRKWGPRPIDLDILTFGNLEIHRANLKIPHPYYHLRRFVLVPFCELDSRFTHPVKKVPNGTLLRRLTPLGQRVTMLARWKKDRFYRSKRRKAPAAQSSR